MIALDFPRFPKVELEYGVTPLPSIRFRVDVKNNPSRVDEKSPHTKSSWEGKLPD